MTDKPSNLREKVEARLAELDRTPTEAARRGGLEESFVRDILRNRKRNVQGENLVKLAEGLDLDPAALLPPKSEIVPQVSDSPIYVVGNVSAGTWIDITSEAVDPATFTRSPFPPDPRFPINAQFDLVVEGTSINNFAQNGQRVRCVKLDAYSWQIETGDLVVVERRRGDLRERTAKRYILKEDGTTELWPDSDDPRWQTPISLGDETGADTMAEIVGVVLYMYDRPAPWRPAIIRSPAK